ncbi:MAG: UvrD-helicase domain-containing protein [Candidatus Hydrogenedentota bacterium]
MSGELNDVQREALAWGDGPALVLAGAGSGKTRVIVERIVNLIEVLGVDPYRILALTFTNRAANEMRDRVRARLGVGEVSTWLGTFHSFGLYILRREMEVLGRPTRFTIADDGDQLSLMKRLVKELPEGLVKVSPRDAMSWISSLKQEVEVPDFDAAAEDQEESSFRELWKRYHAVLEQSSAVDFDDLLVLPAKLFLEHPEVAEKYRRRFTHVLVDEYQDTNRAQYVIARELSGEGGNIFVVGDEDQSIYSWRGANIRNILDFEKDFPGAEVFRLEQNYRSTDSILKAANAVVSNNTERLGKTLWTANKGGEKVGFYLAENGDDEAQFIVDSIKKKDYPAREVAVLYRTNGQARSIEEAFMRKGVHYTVVGGVRFYSRKEIKDILCYMRLLVNPVDDEALRRIINVPARGIGGVTLAKLADQARATQKPLLEALREAEDDSSYGPKLRNTIREFVEWLDELTFDVDSMSVEDLIEKVLEETSYREYVEKSDEKDFRTRLELVDEFVSACANYDKRTKDKDESGLGEFLQELSLASEVDGLDVASPAVTLMTCHSAKGLEFDHVFLIGFEEGLLPHIISLDEDGGIEEERRLTYVAMTRARKTLMLTAAESRTMYGEWKPREVSRFFHEIPSEIVQSEASRTKSKSKPMPRGLPTLKEEALKLGTKVRHGKFGTGVVMYTSGTGAKLKARIRFDTGMSRQFMVSAAPIEILEK